MTDNQTGNAVDALIDQSVEASNVIEKPTLWSRLIRHPSVLIGSLLMLIIALMVPFATTLTSLDPTEINPRNRNKPPGYEAVYKDDNGCLLYTSPSPRDS